MSFRRDVITKPIFSWARGVLPSMSDTEREALEAGDVWWDADLFTGNPDWTKLLAYPQAVLTDEEKAFLHGPVDELCAMLDDWKINWEWRDLPGEVWDFIKREKFFGMIIPKEHGGLGFSPHAHSAVVRQISSRSLTPARPLMVANSRGHTTPARHPRGAEPASSARRRDRPSPSAVDAGVPERPEPGPRCLYPHGLHLRRPGMSRSGLEDADDGTRRRARHLAAVTVGRLRGLRRAHHRRICADPRAVQRAHRQIRRHRGAAGPHRRHGVPARCGAAADLRRA